MAEEVRVRELVAWGVDESVYRPPFDVPATPVAPYSFDGPVLVPVPRLVLDLLAVQAVRTDLLAEMEGLEWTTGVVDLRKLIAFQRRLVFDEAFVQPEVPAQGDWVGLVELAFGPRVCMEYTRVAEGSEVVLQSANPNFQIRWAGGGEVPFEVYGGSPFLEVAEYRGRWFLRDGYHRAYRMLRAGVACCPALIVRAQTLAELGPVQPWFFSEEVLSGARPPMVRDFLEDGLTIEYGRVRLLKTVRVRIEESMELSADTKVDIEEWS